MHQLIDDWNKAHKPYFVEFCVFPYLKSGIFRGMDYVNL